MGKLANSMAVIITDNKSCFSVYEPEYKWLFSTFKGIVNYQLIMEHLKNGQCFSQDNEILGALVDLRSLRGSYYKLFEFLEKEAYPNLKSRGMITQAFIVSDDLLIAHITEKLMDMFIRLNINARMFNDFDEAKVWLKENIEL